MKLFQIDYLAYNTDTYTVFMVGENKEDIEKRAEEFYTEYYNLNVFEINEVDGYKISVSL